MISLDQNLQFKITITDRTMTTNLYPSSIRRAISITVAVAAIFFAQMPVHAAITVSSDELKAESDWTTTNLLNASQSPPFSFTYDGQSSTKLLPQWQRTQADSRVDVNRTRHVITWSNGTLEVRCVAIQYNDYPAVEWTVYLKNTGASRTPIIADIQGLDTTISRSADGPEFVLHGNKGDFTTKDSYEPFDLTLDRSVTNSFAPAAQRDDGRGWTATGKSCDGPKGWPYYNLQMPDGGIILAIGWPGQWASSFVRNSSVGLRIVAGQQLTHLYLKPGEEIRTPLIAMLFWRGTDTVRAQNLWRRWYLADNAPRLNGGPQPITAQGLSDDPTKLSRLLAAGIKLDNLWRDAEGRGGTWWPSESGPYHRPKPGEIVPPMQKEATAWWNTGTWDVDPVKNPQGFKPVSDWCHSNGMTFMLWFEPERVGNPNSWLATNHPDWLIPTGNLTYGVHPSFDPILNEGNPAALEWLVNHIDGLIKSQGIDIYREDMNGGGPCPAWRKNDAPDRQGITENFYVQGHLALWDELKRRNPHLRIDSCASGGRRNDLETMRRGISIGNRSDFLFPNPDVVEGNQGQTYGLSFWLPYQASVSPYPDPYSYRSFYLTSFGVYGDLNVQKTAYAEWRRVAAYTLGDYYPLTSYSIKRDQWIAWQFDRPDLNSGEVQAFRRPDSPYASGRFKLHGLDADASYAVENLDGGTETHSGRELMDQGLHIKTTNAPAAMIFIYKRVEKSVRRHAARLVAGDLENHVLLPSSGTAVRQDKTCISDYRAIDELAVRPLSPSPTPSPRIKSPAATF